MKIKKVNVEKLELKLLKPLRVAFTTFEGATTVLIKIETDEGIIGYGEAHPPVIITGETSDSVIEAIRSIGKHLEGIDPLEIPRIHHMMNVLMFGNTAAKAGIDMALYDIAAKHAGLPLYRYLGGGNNRVDTDVTIGINSSDVMISEAKAIIRKGYRMIKVKIGKSAKDDVVLIKSLRRSIDSNVKIRLDANQGYTVTEAILVMKALEAEDIELVEQPIKHWDYQGLQTIRNKAIIPL
ncbi:MAG: enolase C-terminal domain-like protein, partial [Eubacteriales bacterium]|nr:enolase C-terminal domain-like protein [Eubacteriales bacterium]